MEFIERRNNIYQFIVPFYHKDGDMVDVYALVQHNKIRVCDLGKTLMRLSYKDDEEEIVNQLISQSHLNEENGNLYLDVEGTDVGVAVMQFCQAIIKLTSCFKGYYYEKE